MTRKEEIIQSARQKEKEIGFSQFVHEAEGVISAYGIGFLEGAEWADATAWKPSDDQMEALANALSLAKNCGEERAFDLRTLYEQLKELKGE